MGQSRKVKTLLEHLPAQADCFLCCLQTLYCPGGFVSHSNGGNGSEPHLASVQTGMNFSRRVYGKQRKAKLLHGIPVLMTGENDFHHRHCI